MRSVNCYHAIGTRTYCVLDDVGNDLTKYMGLFRNWSKWLLNDQVE